MNTHWINWLPEIGTPIVERTNRLAEKRARLEALKKAIREDEKALVADVKKLWSADDIALAKETAAREMAEPL